MRKLFLTLAIIFSTSLLFSQNWILDWYKTGDRDFLSNEITKKANQGYLPVGIEVAPDPNGQIVSLYVLYINDQTLGITAWYLNTYTNDVALENGINAMGKENFVPKEVAYYRGTYYVLFLKFRNSASAWTIQNAVYSNQGLSSTINKYDAMGYVPFGYTLVKGALSLLFVKIPLNTSAAWNVQVYNGLNEMKRGISSRYGQGWSPWALLIDGNDYVVMYLTN